MVSFGFKLNPCQGLLVWCAKCLNNLLTARRITDLELLWEGCAVVAMFCQLLADSADVAQQRALMTWHLLCAARYHPVHPLHCIEMSRFSTTLHYQKNISWTLPGVEESLPLVLCLVLLHCILRDALFPAVKCARAQCTDMHISAWNDCFRGCTTNVSPYKGERKSDPLSSLLASLQDAVKGGDHFTLNRWGGGWGERYTLSLLLAL